MLLFKDCNLKHIVLFCVILNVILTICNSQFIELDGEDEDDSNEDETPEERAERKSIEEDSYLTVVSYKEVIRA